MSPGFFFESLVKEVSAPPGQPASFQFQLTNPGSEREIRVEPATLTQERNGSITYDPDADPSDSITFQTPTEFTVGSGQTFTIEGTINSVQEAGAQQYYGVFVYDQGRPVTVNQGGSSDARIQVNYVTRYLLRVELSVSGVAFENFDALTIQESGLRSRDGQAYAYAVLRNDLNAVVDLKLQAQLRKKRGPSAGATVFPPLTGFGIGSGTGALSIQHFAGSNRSPSEKGARTGVARHLSDGPLRSARESNG